MPGEKVLVTGNRIRQEHSGARPCRACGRGVEAILRWQQGEALIVAAADVCAEPAHSDGLPTIPRPPIAGALRR